MQSDHGHDQPATGGNDGENGDEEVWRDLVARLQEPEFMDGLDDDSPDDFQDAKGVGDFDPLGVWQRQSSPAPSEPVYGQGPQTGSAAAGPRDYEADDLDEEFVPAELPSLAGADPAIVVSWIGAAGGPIFLVIAAIFWRSIPLFGVLGVIAAFLAGTGYLLYRLPKNRDHDSGDGAVV